MGNHQHLTAVLLQHVAQLHLQRVAQVCIESRKGLVQHQHTRLIDQNAGQRDTLLLSARQLRGLALLQSVQLHQLQHVPKAAFLFRTVLFAVQAADNVLPYRHVGEERVILEEIADTAALRRKVDALFGIEEHHTVQLYMAAVGFFYAGNALERQALAAAGGAK